MRLQLRGDKTGVRRAGRNSNTRSDDTEPTALRHRTPNSHPGREAAAADLGPRQQGVEGASPGTTASRAATRQHPAPCSCPASASRSDVKPPTQRVNNLHFALGQVTRTGPRVAAAQSSEGAEEQIAHPMPRHTYALTPELYFLTRGWRQKFASPDARRLVVLRFHATRALKAASTLPPRCASPPASREERRDL